MNECPYPRCTALAQIVNMYVLESTDGPIEHIRMRCAESHIFDGPVFMLDKDAEDIDSE